MVIYVWSNGDWAYSWHFTSPPKDAKAINLDTWYKYDLSHKEIKACMEALGA